MRPGTGAGDRDRATHVTQELRSLTFLSKNHGD